jgi:H+/Cl- antiporter ClcA
MIGSRQHSPQPNIGTLGDLRKFSIDFWLLVVLTGMGAGISGGLLMKLLFAVQHVAWPSGTGDFLDEVRSAPLWRHIWVMALAGLIAGLGRVLIRFATGGHGGELSESIWFKAGRLPLISTIAKAVLSIVIVGMGAAIGREGALKQTGAALAAKLSDWSKLSPAQRRLLAACGAGAGMAAAYNVPLGGALFSLEVLLGTMALPLVLPALASSVIATGVSWVFLPAHATYQVPVYALSFPQIAWAAITGPILGIASAGYIRLIGWADKQKPRGIWMVLAPVMVFTLLGCSAVRFPELLGNGKDVVQRALTSDLPLALLAILMMLRPLATALCLGSGAPGGLFTPTMTLGALLGGTLGHIWGAAIPGGTPGSYALLGAGAVLAATTQGPISSIVLMIELTRRADAQMVPMLVAITLASLTCRRVESQSIYSARVKQREAACVAKGRGAAEYVVLPASATYAQVVRRLLEAAERSISLVVADMDGKLVGEITTERARDAERSVIPLDTATAGDLAEVTPTFERLVRSNLLNPVTDQHEQYQRDTARRQPAIRAARHTSD